MSNLKMQILLIGINQKLNRGEILEDILTSYVNLTVEEKLEITNKLINSEI